MRFTLILLLLFASQFVTLAQGTTFTVNSNTDGDDANIGDNTCATSSGDCTLRAAIQEANADADLDTIEFALPGSTVITPETDLPDITQPIFIDGLTQLDQNGQVSVILRSPEFADVAEHNALVLRGGDSTVRGLAIVEWDGAAIEIAEGENNTIQANVLGIYERTDTGSETILGNDTGLRVLTDNNTIGGTATLQGQITASNLIGGNRLFGIAMSGSNNRIEGNFILGNAYTAFADYAVEVGGTANAIVGNVISYNDSTALYLTGSEHVVQGNAIGTSPDGTEAWPNNTGIGLLYGIVIGTNGSNITIGGATEAERNFLAANGDGNIVIEGDNNTVQGNTIGTDGAVRLWDVFGSDGIEVEDTGDGNRILNNLISGNESVGISLQGNNNVVQGNTIGTDATGTTAIPNNVGIMVGGDGNQIGGTTEAERNLISGNEADGVRMAGAGNTLQGNTIGLNRDGNLSLQNDRTGVSISAGENNLVIDNVISGNDTNGLLIDGGMNHRVENNLIGTNATGNAPVGNNFSGIELGSSVAGLLITGNTIAGNESWGIDIDFGTGAVTIENNLIGLNAQGAAIGNQRDGIYVFRDNVTIQNNTIANNLQNGIEVTSSTGVLMRGNRIVANGQLGIDLASTEGVDTNDPGDGDTGANNGQNYPIISDVTSSGGNITINGTLNSTAGNTYTLDFYANATCDPSGNGEGQFYIGELTGVTTDGSGNAAFSVTFPVPGGQFITATATDGGNNTSEFSPCVAFSGAVATPTPTSPVTPTPVPGTPTSTPDPANPTPTPTSTTLQRLAPVDGQVITSAGDYISRFQWAPVSGAEWYQVFVSSPDFSQVALNKWYRASDVCSGSVCTTSDDIWLVGNGEYSWWMTYWSPAIGSDYRNRYSETRFTLNLPQPGAVTGIAPTGDVSGNITLEWSGDALWYQVWVGPADYSATTLLEWRNAALVCNGGLCSLTIGALSPGDYEFWIRAWNPAGTTGWQQMTSFTVTP